MNGSPEKDTLNLTDVVRELRSIFAADDVNIDQVKALLRAYRSNPKDWQKYTKFDAARLV
jgi:cysteine dioxygenase